MIVHDVGIQIFAANQRHRMHAWNTGGITLRVATWCIIIYNVLTAVRQRLAALQENELNAIQSSHSAFRKPTPHRARLYYVTTKPTPTQA